MTEKSKPVLRKTGKIIPEISGEQNAKTLLFSRVFVAFEKGFEPPTPALGGRCSVLLSYSNKSRFFWLYNTIFGLTSNLQNILRKIKISKIIPEIIPIFLYIASYHNILCFICCQPAISRNIQWIKQPLRRRTLYPTELQKHCYVIIQLKTAFDKHVEKYLCDFGNFVKFYIDGEGRSLTWSVLLSRFWIYANIFLQIERIFTIILFRVFSKV